MSKILSVRNTTLKSNNSASDKNLNILQNNNIIKVIQHITKPLIRGNNSMVFNNNKLFYSKNFSSESSKIKSTLPSLSQNNSKKKIINSQKNKIIKIMNSNSSNDINTPKNIISPKIKQLNREKTQSELLHQIDKINILKDVPDNKKMFKNIFRREETKIDDENNKNNNKNNNYFHNKNRYNIKHIRNINNVNIHIYSTRMNTELEEEKKTNTINTTFFKTEHNFPTLLNNNENFPNDNHIDKRILNKKVRVSKNKELINRNNEKSYILTPKKEIVTKYSRFTNSEPKINLTKSQFKKINELPKLIDPENPILYKSNLRQKTYKSKKISNLKSYASIPMLTIDSNSDSKNVTINNKEHNYKSTTHKVVKKLGIRDHYNKGAKKTININRRYRFEQFDLNNFENINNFTYIKQDKDRRKLNTEGNINISITKKKEELNNIDETKYYLKEIDDDEKKNSKHSILVLFIKLIQIHMDIEMILDNNNTNNNKVRRRISTVNNDKIYKINNLINYYFNTLSYLLNFTQIQDNCQNNESKNKQDEINISNSFLYQKYNIFNFNLINNLFHKCIKLQICYYAAFMVCISQLSYEDIDTMIKANFEKIIKEISEPLYNLFKIFMMNEVIEKYNKMLSNIIRPNFFIQIKKYFIEDKMIYAMKKSDILKNISNNINICSDSLKSFSNYNLKSSLIKPFGDAFNQMLFKLERKTLKMFIDIFLNMILFGELEINKQKMFKSLESPTKNISKSRFNTKKDLNLGSSLFNNINDTPPFLPEINEKYKYTLVLDMDETLVHFFFTTMNGMFFVRPYCFEFLNELNKYYEIVTFTAGMKDYANSILNLLDLNNNIIKYRLYRQHVTIAGFSSYKNLKLLGRDLKRTIIIDNLKENFMLQPDNGLYIKTWTSDVNDTQFIDLLNILKNIAINDVNDVRPIIQKINDKINYNEDLINPYSKINIKKIIDDEKK